ncbi:hypothetical protein CYFUS_009162 [Cystobacter fuscus]|uniref:Lipoprotein n=2 Tax=Cystobacter fuscus TaxID=43 RepID=A0A250JJM9_9BACT|nr:hypothetical protein CYFUS_009162 [Cystobacter fuscus]
MSDRRTVCWRFAHLFLASVLLAGCVSGPQRFGRGELRLDSVRAAQLRQAVVVGEVASPVAPAATRVVASSFARNVPLLLTLLKSDNAVSDFEERLAECARQAEHQVNFSFFGNRSPTRAECGEEVDVDGCGGRITRAMLLGQRKHALALQCAREVLEQLWPAPFSIEQRYRYYKYAEILETVSREEEARLLAEGCTRALWRTIKPDIVLHADRNLLRSVLTLDYKFPCPDTNEPRWTRYGESSAYAGFNQGEIYRQALGGEVFLISPMTGVIQ